MSRYDNSSREELIRRIEQLEEQLGPEAGSAERFRERYACKILDSIPAMLTVLDRQGQLVELVSSEDTNHVGAPSSEIVGQNIREMLSPEAYRNVHNNLENVFVTGCGSSSHHDITLEGVTHNYENRIFPLDGDHALCICRDITDAEAAKHELEMVKYALNNVDEEIYACDLDGTMEYANEQYRLRHNITDELSNHKVYEFWSFKGTRQQWEDRLRKIRRDGGSHKYTVRFKDDQGRIMAWDVVAYIIYDHFKEREIVWFFGRDVTLRIEHEIKVKEMNSLLDSILNYIPVYLFVKDPGNDFRYLYWNQAFAEYSGIPIEKAIGHSDSEIFPNPKDAEHFRRDDLELLRTGERVTLVEEYVNTSGETRIVNTSKSLVPVENRLPLIIGVSWDITDLKNAELEIVEARIRAEESDKLKSAFLANMSHEIRTPLNAIVGFSSLMQSEELSQEERAEYCAIVVNNSEMLLTLLNDILDISSLECGKIRFNYASEDIVQICQHVMMTTAHTRQEGVEGRLECAVESFMLTTDAHRLSQILINLLTNAGKFTSKGSITLGVEIDKERNEVLFSVTDTGPGIPLDKQEMVFNRFEKLDGNKKKGTGLGLAICRQIAMIFGGRIWVDPTYTGGARFIFAHPIGLRLPEDREHREGGEPAGDVKDPPCSRCRQSGSNPSVSREKGCCGSLFRPKCNLKGPPAGPFFCRRRCGRSSAAAGMCPAGLLRRVFRAVLRAGRCRIIPHGCGIILHNFAYL